MIEHAIAIALLALAVTMVCGSLFLGVGRPGRHIGSMEKAFRLFIDHEWFRNKVMAGRRDHILDYPVLI